jgi:hypothetical protein
MIKILIIPVLVFCLTIVHAQAPAAPEPVQEQPEKAKDTVKEEPPTTEGMEVREMPKADSVPALPEAAKDTARTDTSETSDSIAAKKDTVKADTVVKKPKKKKRKKRIQRDKRVKIDKDVDVIQTYKGNINKLKSPKKAFFLSFILPGLGEFYSRGGWIRIGIPFATELACYASIFVIRSEYNDLVKIYEEYADKYYDHKRFADFYNYIHSDEYNTDTLFLKWEIDPFSHDSIYFEDYENQTSDYYEMIGKYDEFVQGWKDATPDMVSNGFKWIKDQVYDTEYMHRFRGFAIDEIKTTSNKVDTVWMYYHDEDIGVKRPRYFGLSEYQIEFMNLRDDANEMGDKVLWVFYTMLINRMVSAVNAVFTANAYNKKITGGKLSAIEKIRVKPVHTGNAEFPSNGVVFTYHF